MIVTQQNFWKVLERFAKPGFYGLDTETTGLRYDDNLFSIVLSDEEGACYFNFNEKFTLLEYQVSRRDLDLYSIMYPFHFKEMQRLVFDNPDSVWFIQNASFDLKKLLHMDVWPKGRIHCTYITERVLKNNYLNYSLDAIAKRRLDAQEKDETVNKYITKNKLWNTVRIEGKKMPIKEKHFHRVPLTIMAPYAVQDAKLHRAIGLQQAEEIAKKPDVWPVWKMEMDLLHVCVFMERSGIKLDVPYVKRAIEHYKILGASQSAEFALMTGKKFSDSPQGLKKAFEELGIEVGITKKGNPSLDKKSLAQIDHPLARIIEDIRETNKYLSTYYASFLYWKSEDDILHPSFNQAGAETGRMSMSNPSLHNIPKEETGEFKVRRCFIPREGMTFFMLDYNQQEFRMMLDYAGEKELIDAINAGADVHQATADLLGISRKFAKTINFGLLYGMGVQKLAIALGISELDAANLKRRYFSRLPKVKEFINAVVNRGKQRGYVFNWCGRRCYIDSSDHAYKLPNHIIQGGCADVSKLAMLNVQSFLINQQAKTRMLLQVHDELLFEVPDKEYSLVPEIQSIMENIYLSRNGMKLTCSIEHSKVNWADKVKGMPSVIS